MSQGQDSCLPQGYSDPRSKRRVQLYQKNPSKDYVPFLSHVYPEPVTEVSGPSAHYLFPFRKAESVAKKRGREHAKWTNDRLTFNASLATSRYCYIWF
jgi:hypothetical protein